MQVPQALVITLLGNEYSERVADRCVESGYDAGIPVKTFDAVRPSEVDSLFYQYGLKWTWGDGYKGMKHKPYGGNGLARMACFLSHFLLWEKCAESKEPLLILEHDAVFINPFVPFEFDSVCMINDPLGATPRGDWWSEQMQKRGPGVWRKTKVFDDSRPDGLAGGSAYILSPEAAGRVIDLVYEVGAWPNDAIICRQFMDLQEHYPFITEVRAGQSTIL